jgi:hypothetical protein
MASPFNNQKQINMTNITRRYLVETLEELLTDEFDSSELVYLTDEELIYRIISSAEWYKEQYNNA